ncbi:hypothetical protein ABZO31_00790 [Streptomyces sp. HUAS MG47]
MTTGHTGALVLDSMLRRGLRPVLAGCDGAAVAGLAARHDVGLVPV